DGSYGAMGGIITTLENFSKYVALHMKAWPEGKENETKVLKNSSLREMHFMWNFSGLNTQASYPSGRNCAMATGYGYGLG
ncbi:hypothetical protein ACXWO5_10865, partial [Streptococcus pyogenes]